jgi:DNA processing protein
MSACDPCLRRARLVALLAPRIADQLSSRDNRARALLALPDEELVASLRGPAASAAELLAGFDARAERSAMEVAGVFAVCGHDDSFPSRLSQLPDCPPVIFARGDPAGLERVAADPAVTLVGSRDPSPYGIAMARSLGRGLAAARVTVVSGLALGIDGAAHRGCLEGGGFPVAVLGGGADVPYPRSNRRLYERVVETGLVLSEMPPGQRAYRWSFPARNRLMAALAGMTVVVEAKEPSGTLITAAFAEDLGRVVGAVPGRATASVAAGANGLLRSGAAVVRSVEDALDDLLGAGQGERALHEAESRRLESLPAHLRRVLEAVESGAGGPEAGLAAGLPARETRIALARLEAEGLIVRGALGSYERVAG